MDTQPKTPKDKLIPFVPEQNQFRDAEQILSQVLQQISDEARQKGSFYAILTPDQRGTVDHLVEDNFSHYSKQFDGSRANFTEAMAKNFVAKVRVFTPLVVAAGYEIHKSTNESQDRNRINNSEVAALTRSASYVLMGEGSFRDSGTNLKYIRIPLRENEKLPNIDQTAGAKLLDVPKIGEYLRLRTKKGDMRTSSITHLFLRGIGASQTVDQMNQTIYHTFDGINNQTLSGNPKR